MLKPTYKLPTLPPAAMLETVAVLKALNRASRALADLKGHAKTIPNQGILIDTLALQEANCRHSRVNCQDRVQLGVAR